jgi:hypothetical protein
MAVKLRKTSLDFAVRLVEEGRFVYDERDAWSEHQPSASAENDFIAHYGWTDYANWHLGVDDSEPVETKAHYKFPYGDFQDVHRCGVLTAESRAGQRKYVDIETPRPTCRA